jgi:hypothetical protein
MYFVNYGVDRATKYSFCNATTLVASLDTLIHCLCGINTINILEIPYETTCKTTIRFSITSPVSVLRSVTGYGGIFIF